MSDFHKSFYRTGEQGNAVVYVLIVIALFAALSFVLSRQSDTSETGTLETERLEVYTAQIIQVSNQVKQGVDQMIYAGTISTGPGKSDISELVFTLPSDAAFGTEPPPNPNKVFHPEGGGIVMPRLQPEAVHQVNADPAPGWYMGRFNNVEWTPLGPGNGLGPAGADLPFEDVILVAHQITQPVCALINEKLTGSSVIPQLTGDINQVLIDDGLHTNDPNIDFDVAQCAACDGRQALCVVNAAGTIWSYYNIIAQQ